MSYRADRLAQQLKDEVSFILARELKDPRVGFVTVTAARVSPDLRYARLFVSIFGSDAEKTETLAALSRATSFVRKQLSSRLRLRHCPEIQFAFDESIEYGAKMDALLAEVGQELRETDSTPEEANP